MLFLCTLAEGIGKGGFPKILAESSVKSVRVLLSNHKQTEQSTSTPRVTPSAGRLRATFCCLATSPLNTAGSSHLQWLQVLNYLFLVSFALSIPLELIQNVLCHSFPFRDDILWNNLHNSFNLEK